MGDPGHKLSAWGKFTATGRIYLGFGASAAGAHSFIMAPNTNQLLFQANANYGFVDLVSKPFTYQLNKWYRMEVLWVNSTTIEGRVYDSDGVTELIMLSLTATVPRGGVALRGIGGADVDDIFSGPFTNKTAPVITSNGGGATADISLSENIKVATSVVATDNERDAVTYSISGGEDQAMFEIDPTTGSLSFKTAPDFENPADVGLNNTYEVIVRATENTAEKLYDEQTITVTITDVDEIAPFIVSIKRQNPIQEYVNDTFVTFRVTFSEEVTGVNNTDFNATEGGTIGSLIQPVTKLSGTEYDVPVQILSGEGSLRLDLYRNASQTGIMDLAGNGLNTLYNTGESYTIDRTAPAAPSQPDLLASSDSGASDSDNLTNQSKPTFTGTAEKGAKVKVFAGGVEIGSAVADATSGIWQVSSSSALADGPHAISATATDAAGNVSPGSTTLAITIDATAPAKPVKPDLMASSDTGSSDSDKLTNDTTPTLTGTAEVGTTVHVYAGAVEVGSATAGADGSWQITATALTAGVYSFTATATDIAGNTSVASDALSVTIDTDKPTAPVIARIADDSGVSNNDGLTNDQTLTLSGTAEASLWVKIYNLASGSLVGNATATASGNWSAALPTLTEGEHTFYAMVTDLAGNESIASNTFTVTVDLTKPTITEVVLPAAKTYGVGEQLDFKVKFSEMLSATGFPRLTITVGSTSRTATWQNQVESNEWVFRYTVQAGDLDVNGIAFALNELVVPTGDVFDRAGNSLVRTFTPGAMTDILIDGVAPAITSVSVPANATYVNGQTMNFTVNFTEPVTVGGSGSLGLDFTPDEGGTQTAAYVSGSGSSALVFRYTVAEGVKDGNGIQLASSLTLSGGMTLIDAPGNNANTQLNNVASTTGVLIDGTAPSVLSVTVPANGTYVAGDNLDFSVTFSKPVEVSGGTPGLPISIGTETVQATLTGGSGTSTLSFRYTVQNNDFDSNGISLAASIASSGATLKDASGNAANLTLKNVPATSGVLVDAVAPQLTVVNIASSNANPARAKVGDVVTVTITANEPIQAPVVTIAGKTATVSAVGTSTSQYTASYTMTSAEAEGAVPFSVAFKDAIGNTGAAVTATTDNSSVVFDRTAPVLNSVTIASNNADAAKAKVGDVVTVSFTANEAIRTPNVTIAGNAATVTAISGNSYSAAYTMAANDVEGAVAFQIDFSDVTGNAATAVSATTDNSLVLFDKTKPALSFVAIASSNADATKAKVGDVVTVSFTADEAIKTPTVKIANQAAAVVAGTAANSYTATYTMAASDPEGNVAISIAFQDVTGNAGTTVTSTTNNSRVVFDRTSPVLASVTIASNNADAAKAKVGDVVTISFTASEPIMTPTVSIAGHAATVTSGAVANSYTAAYTMAASDPEGPVTFEIKFTDVTGNAAVAVTATTNNSRVVFDRTAPSLTSVAIASSNADAARAKVGDVVTVTLTANEAIMTPIVTIAGQTATVTAGTGNTYTASYTMAATDAEGTVAFNISFKDVTGNEGADVNRTTDNSLVVFDITAPVLTSVAIASSNADAAKAKVGDVVTVSFTANEAIKTPAVTIAGNAATVTAGTGNAYSAAYTMKANDTEGTVAFRINFADVTGNAATAVTATTNSSSVVFDRTAPVLTAVTIVSNNASATRAKVGDVITVSFTSNEPVMTPVVTIAGNAATVTAGTAANSYTATYTMASSDPEGLVAFNISFTDVTGNPGAAVNTTTNGSSVLFDRTAPAGYGVAFVQNMVTVNNSSAITLRVTNAEPNIPYSYTVTSAAGGTPVTGSATAITGNFDIANVNLSGLNDGMLTVTFFQTDLAGNRGANVTAQVMKYRNMVSVARPAALQVPYRTTFAQLTKPATVEVSFSNGSKQQVAVTWLPGNYSTDGKGAGEYVLTGTLAVPSDATNLSNLTAEWTVRIMPNKAPTDITLSKSSFQPDIKEDQAIGAFTTVDEDDPYPGDAAHNYVLVDGVGSTDNSMFTIVGNQLFLKRGVNLYGRTQFSIRVESRDSYYSVNPNNKFSKVFTITKEGYDTAAPDLKIVNAFTPNGDGKNDTWRIPELEYYNNVEIQVFDRSGVLIFQTNDPTMKWDGRNKNGQVLAGPYLYVIHIKDINYVKRGTVTILKN